VTDNGSGAGTGALTMRVPAQEPMPILNLPLVPAQELLPKFLKIIFLEVTRR
jgi:hypothetical protein